MNISRKGKTFLFASILVLILFCGSLFFLFREQGNAKMTAAPPLRTFGGLRPVLSPTATALFSDNFF